MLQSLSLEHWSMIKVVELRQENMKQSSMLCTLLEHFRREEHISLKLPFARAISIYQVVAS